MTLDSAIKTAGAIYGAYKSIQHERKSLCESDYTPDGVKYWICPEKKTTASSVHKYQNSQSNPSGKLTRHVSGVGTPRIAQIKRVGVKKTSVSRKRKLKNVKRKKRKHHYK